MNSSIALSPVVSSSNKRRASLSKQRTAEWTKRLGDSVPIRAITMRVSLGSLRLSWRERFVRMIWIIRSNDVRGQLRDPKLICIAVIVSVLARNENYISQLLGRELACIEPALLKLRPFDSPGRSHSILERPSPLPADSNEYWQPIRRRRRRQRRRRLRQRPPANNPYPSECGPCPRPARSIEW